MCSPIIFGRFVFGVIRHKKTVKVSAKTAAGACRLWTSAAPESVLKNGSFHSRRKFSNGFNTKRGPSPDAGDAIQPPIPVFRAPDLGSSPFNKSLPNHWPFFLPRDGESPAPPAVDENIIPQWKAGAGMKCWFRFISVPTVDTPGTVVLLHFDDKRYLFGQLGEGTQRALLESNIRSHRLNHIFLTGHMSWANHGGLLGVLLNSTEALKASTTAVASKRQGRLARAKSMLQHFETRNTMGAQRKRQEIIGLINHLQSREGDDAAVLDCLHVFGPKNLTHAMAASRMFVLKKDRPLHLQEWEDCQQTKSDDYSPIEPSWQDCHIKVWNLNVSPTTETEVSSRGNGDENENAHAANDVSNTENGEEDARCVRHHVISDIFKTPWEKKGFQEMPLSVAPFHTPLFIRNRANNMVRRFTRPTDPAPNIDVLVRKAWPGTRLPSLPPSQPSLTSISYIIQHQDVRGKFDPSKALSLGVEWGPNFGRLTKGECVTAKDGTVITPEMVLGASCPGQALAVIDLPTTAYIENFLKRPEWSRNPGLVQALKSVVWILGPGLASDERLRDFMSKMPGVKHIIASPDHCPNHVAFTSSAVAAVQFAMIDPERYQAPVCDVTPVAPTTATAIQPAHAGLTFKVQPTFSVDDSMPKPSYNPMELRTKNPFRHSRVPKFHHQEKSLGDDIEIVTLGTGSSSPSKSRNVSATLVRVPGVGNYLLDCGENTLGQLRRMFQPDDVVDILRDLRLIWISHLHADHHLGTISVIRAWKEVVYGSDRSFQKPNHEDPEKMVREKRLCVISGEQINNFLREFASVDDYGYDMTIQLIAKDPGDRKSTFDFLLGNGGAPLRDAATGNSKLRSPRSTLVSFSSTGLHREDQTPLTPLLQEALGVADISTCFVQHCNDSRGIAITFKDGFKLCYSGDCRPSASLVRIGLDADILIHEATFEDDMLGDALAKKHSTVSEALSLAKQMCARKVILTHFSQRYYSVPVIPSWAGGRVPVLIAFDMMRLRLGDAMTAQRYLPILMKRFVPEQLENGADEAGKKKSRKY